MLGLYRKQTINKTIKESLSHQLHHMEHHNYHRTISLKLCRKMNKIPSKIHNNKVNRINYNQMSRYHLKKWWYHHCLLISSRIIVMHPLSLARKEDKQHHLHKTYLMLQAQINKVLDNVLHLCKLQLLLTMYLLNQMHFMKKVSRVLVSSRKIITKLNRKLALDLVHWTTNKTHHSIPLILKRRMK